MVDFNNCDLLGLQNHQMCHLPCHLIHHCRAAAEESTLDVQLVSNCGVCLSPSLSSQFKLRVDVEKNML